MLKISKYLKMSDSMARPKYTNGADWFYHILTQHTWKIVYRDHKILKMPRDILAKRFEKESIPDVQDYIANYPMEAFNTYMQTSKTRSSKPSEYIETFILATAIISNEDIAAIIFKKYFMNKNDVQKMFENSKYYIDQEADYLANRMKAITERLEKEFGSRFIIKKIGHGLPPINYEFSIYLYPYNNTIENHYRLKYDVQWQSNVPHKHILTDDDLIEWLKEDIQNTMDEAFKKHKKQQKKNKAIKNASGTLFFVNHGVDFSHRHMHVKTFPKLKDAQEYYDMVIQRGGYSDRIVELTRNQYDQPKGKNDDSGKSVVLKKHGY